jgi:hypothetical protein
VSEFDRQKRGSKYEGWAFTFCKAALLVLLFQRYSLLALSGLAAIFYVAASQMGVKQFRCWAKPPWITIFWTAIFGWQIWMLLHHRL